MIPAPVEAGPCGVRHRRSGDPAKSRAPRARASRVKTCLLGDGGCGVKRERGRKCLTLMVRRGINSYSFLRVFILLLAVLTIAISALLAMRDLPSPALAGEGGTRSVTDDGKAGAGIAARKDGLPRRFAPRNDELQSCNLSAVIASGAKQSRAAARKDRLPRRCAPRNDEPERDTHLLVIARRPKADAAIHLGRRWAMTTGAPRVRPLPLGEDIKQKSRALARPFHVFPARPLRPRELR